MNLRLATATTAVFATAAFAVAVAWTWMPSVPSPKRIPVQQASAPTTLLKSETALERLHRLLPNAPIRWSPIQEPYSRDAPDIERSLLTPRKHDGHAGLYTARPEGYRPVAIVMHAAGSGKPGSEFASLESLRAYFQQHAVAASHYAIDRDGRIMQFVDDRSAAFHVSTPGWNSISLGIELLNDNTGTQAFPPAQMAATRRLVEYLGNQYDIPAEGVVRHRDIQPVDRQDPPANFPWDDFANSLRDSTDTRSGERLAQGQTRLTASRTTVPDN